ncbi:MAG: hypothetical protein WA210_11780 [Burkholderiaceae bacterium]
MKPWRTVGLLLVVALQSMAGAFAAEDYSPAERALFMTNQFAKLKPPLTLHYGYTKGGSLEPGFTDKVAIHLRAQASGKCCTANTEFLGGTRRLSLPEVEAADGNPVVLYFLERDIREMSRLTKGQSNYFRKRIRMAVYQGAQISELSLPYRGKSVAAQQILISPYLDDPLRVRYENLATKQYLFTLSDAVPGGVYGIRTFVAARAGGSVAQLEEEMVLDGASPVPRKP